MCLGKIIPLLPKLTVNGRFIRAFVSALGLVEERKPQ
jgi:hypothetical protein